MRKNFPGVDIIRFTAATLVLFFHLLYFSPAAIHVSLLDPLTWFGWVGVEVFFVISGFVISYSAGDSALQFARSRVLRLYPVAWICATATLLVLVATNPPADLLGAYARSIILWPYPTWIDGAYWTLAIELAFYALVLLILAVAGRHKIVPVVAVVGVMSSFYWFARIVAKQRGVSLEFTDPDTMKLLLIPHGCYFAIGTMLYALLLEGDRRVWVKPVLALSVLAAILEISSVAKGKPEALAHVVLIAVPVAIWLLSVAALVLAVRYNDRVSRLVSPALARSIGIMTYPLYLIHSVLGGGVATLLSGWGTGRWIALGGSLLASLAAALLISTIIEPPVRRLLAVLIGARAASSQPVIDQAAAP